MQIGAAYIRVSTDDQTELSPDAQKREILKYAKANQIIVPPELIFVENGISGRKADRRPEFQRMIATARQKPKPFDVLLLWKFSRFARNQDESSFYKSILRKKCGIDVVSITEPVMEGMYGRLIETIIEWSDEFYSYNLAQEVRRGMTEKALRGGYQAKPPMGYRYTGPGQVPEVVPERAAIVRRIFEEYAAGYDRTGIARRLNADGVLTDRGNRFENRVVGYILQNPFYIGKVRWNYRIHSAYHTNPEEQVITRDGQHEAIISQQLWDTVQTRLAADRKPVGRRRNSSSASSHWLSGILICSACGHTLAYGGPVACRSFNCHEYAKGRCKTSHSITVKKAEREVIAELQHALETGQVEYTFAQPEDHRSDVEAAIRALDTREQRAKSAYLAGIDTLEEYGAIRRSIRQEREKLLKKAAPEVDPEQAKAKLLEKIRSVCDMLQSDDFTIEQKGNALRSVVQKIVYDRPNRAMHFYYHFS